VHLAGKFWLFDSGSMREREEAARGRWRGLISEQRASGQSVAAFCRERGLCAPQFYYWGKRLSQAAETNFVEAVIVEQQPAVASVVCAGIELRLCGGYSLLVQPGFDACHLRALLAVLESGS
jgi:hypothetical protein